MGSVALAAAVVFAPIRLAAGAYRAGVQGASVDRASVHEASLHRASLDGASAPVERLAVARSAPVRIGAERAAANAAQVLDRIVAIVGPQVITLSDVRAATAFDLLPEDVGPAGSGDGGGATPALASIVERLVRRELMRAEIERFGVVAPASEAIAARIEALRRRFSSEAAFTAALEGYGLSEARFRAWVVDDARIEVYIQQRFDAAAQPTDEDVLQYYQSREPEFAVNGRPRPFNDVRDEARRRLVASRRQALIDDWVAGLMRRTDVTIRPLRH